jgi:hypothetical protein
VGPMFPVSLDCRVVSVARFSFTLSSYLLYVLCLVRPMFPVSLDCPSLIAARFTLVFIYYRMENPEILETMVTPDTGHTIGSK